MRIWVLGVAAIALLSFRSLASDPLIPAEDGSVAQVAAAPMAEPEIPVTPSPVSKDDELNLGWTLIRTAVALGFVVLLVYLTLNVGLRRLLGIRPLVGTSMVTVLERVPLDQKRVLYVVRAAGEVLLLGASDSSVSLISKLDPKSPGDQHGANS